MLRILKPCLFEREWSSSHSGSYSSCPSVSSVNHGTKTNIRNAFFSNGSGKVNTFGKPLAWAPRMVTSPGSGFGLSMGIYCFTDSRRVVSCLSAVARGYSRICWHGVTCSTTRNGLDCILIFLFLCNQVCGKLFTFLIKEKVEALTGS